MTAKITRMKGLPVHIPFVNRIFIVALLMLHSMVAYLQQSPVHTTPPPPVLRNILQKEAMFSGRSAFIKNIGQYEKFSGVPEALGKIEFGFEGFSGPVLFTPHGFIHVQQKTERLSHAEEEALEQQGLAEEEIEHRRKKKEQVITMQWADANPYPKVIEEDGTTNYFTYGTLPGKTYGYKRIIYKELYPGIDLVYHISSSDKKGFEYSFIVHPGGDPARIKMKYGGGIDKIHIDKNGHLVITSTADTLYQSLPISYNSLSTGTSSLLTAAATGKKIKSSYRLSGKTISFFTGNYDRNQSLVIDPFITAASGFTGLNGGVAKDVDFDYLGNVYVAGGGEYAQYQLSKFSAAGNLLWTFNGAVASIPWVFGIEYGGWAVEKSTGKVYLGQGFNSSEGTKVIRIDASGVYDNYVSTGDVNFKECWKMVWNCAGGNPQILLCGGSTISNVNFSLLSPPALTISPVNITNIPVGSRQDIADAVVDPLNNDLYTIYANAGNTAGVDNKIFKHNFPYSAATVVWQIPTGFTNLREANNRPYLHTVTGSTTENSINALAVNSNFLFYWDGAVLIAFNKATGATAGTPLLTGLPEKFQGGIYADECNNVFAGYANGLIKVFKFNGSAFDDAAAADITITGFSTSNVYDLAYNAGDRLLYASGNGFVAAFDVSGYCPGNVVYSINVVPDCATLSATATLVPAAPVGAVVTYSLFDGTTFITSNTTGVFTGLSGGITYTAKAVINQSCSGAQATSVNFDLNSCNILTATVINAVCGSNNGSITINAAFGTTPYQYSLDAVNFQPGNIFSGLPPNIYTITVKDALGVVRSIGATIINTIPSFTITPAITAARCGANNGAISITATGGVLPYQYSLDGINFQNGNSFTGLVPGNYTITIKDQNNCRPTKAAVIPAITPPSLTTISAAATCGQNNGSITSLATGGTAPYQYSIDAVNFQPGNTFSAIAPGSYTITIKDADNCIASAPADIAATPLIAGTTNTSATNCSNDNGSVTVNANGGTLPYTYSINSGPYQSSNIFNGLATGNYTVQIKDGANCIISLPAATVGLINNITVNAGIDKEICEGSSITLDATATNATGFSWLPAAGLNNATILQPAASPGTTTTYTLTATAGPCTQTATVEVLVNTRPVANAGPDESICYGQSFQLNGSGGIFYQWSPANYLNSTTIQNPFAANPARTISYTLRVTDEKGCTSAQADAVTITILPPAKLFAGNDTAIVINQSLQMQASDINSSGFTQYTWTPSTGLSNPFIKNPIAVLDNTTRFQVQASTPEGCIGIDDIVVTVFKQGDIFVPTAFTPNNDQLNDYAVAIPAGILSFRYFRIYNRWGALVFSTTDYRKGWDGNVNGKPEGSATYAWVAEAVDYKGKVIRKKGLVTLIR
jgi:gliding motility-associated-like protein